MKVSEPQKRVLAYFMSYEKENGRPPTLAECAAFLGCSRENVRQAAVALKRKGLMDNEHYKVRSWRAKI